MSDLPAGRELDALIAEKVMGLRIEHREPYWTHSDPHQLPIPTYSTSIADAWEVVEKLRSDDFNATVECCPESHDLGDGEQCYADFFCGDSNGPHKPGTKHGQAWAATAPHAICLAALATVGGLDV